MKTVLVIFGGASPEHDVSCSSGASLIAALRGTGRYEVLALGITKAGAWLLTDAPQAAIADGISWETDPSNKKAILSPDRADHGLLVFDEDGTHIHPIDVVFPIIHGETGEDGALQGLLEIAGIPYVGSGVCPSACSMDKTVTMIFADLCGIRRPVYYSGWSRDVAADIDAAAASVEAFFTEKLGSTIYPLFVKPASTGSSVGISKADDPESLKKGLALAASFPGRVIVEQGISGREMKIAVLGSNGDLRTGEICEVIVAKGTFNDYTMKYKTTDNHKQIPADIPAESAAALRKAAMDIYTVLGCRGFARADFFLEEDGGIVFNEINTVPGFTGKSIYSLMFEEAGLPYAELCATLVESALI